LWNLQLLTRPLAYKGPTDHLSQFFELDDLYNGIKLLLDDVMMDWQHLKDDSRVQGVFLYQDKLAKCSFSWPFKSDHADNYCSCDEFQINAQNSQEKQSCVHLAALAIESKVQIDRLPPSLKQQEVFSSERDYLTDWIKRQQHDPFPNMARHRVVYILAENSGEYSLTIHKAYLTQQQEFQLKAPLSIKTSVADKLPKFVSLTDQEILTNLQKLVAKNSVAKQEENQVLLGSKKSINSEIESFLTKVIQSGRAFWRACHRSPLSIDETSSFDERWQSLSENLSISKAESRVYRLRAFSHAQLVLLRKLHATDFDLNGISPKLVINSQKIAVDWKEGTLFEFESAEVKFVVATSDGNGVELTYSEIQHLVSGDQSISGRALVEHTAGKLHLLQWMESIASNFQPPVASQFEKTTRLLNGDFSHWFPMIRGLQLEGWIIEFAPGFKLNQKQVEDWYSRVNQIDAESATNWFELEVGVKVDGEPVNILPFIVEAFRSGQLDLSEENNTISFTLDDGRVIGISRQRVQSIVDTLMELSESKPLVEQKLRLPENQLVRVNLIENELSEPVEWMDADGLRKKAKALAESDGVQSVSIPKNIQAELREYQKRGVDWLQFLSQQDIGGILADDMGLGKTLQTLTHIQIEKSSGRMVSPCMVVAPTSLLGNWLAEAKKFTPDLKLVHWAGNRRQQKSEQLSQADIIITSYGLLLRDFPLLNKLDLHLLVLDEAQAIKNSRAKVSKIAFSMKSRLRLCLTGTPLENHLGELWSLFHFLMPGLLGEQAQFKKLFQIPIEKEQDWQRQQQLAQRIAPFMLRRTKDKVASDLPAKTEISEVIELSETQADLYETVRMTMLEEVQKAMTQNSKGGNQLIIGNALLRLRQICCHPDLVDFGQAESDSAKLTWLKAVLPELVQSGSRVLLFSSFTSMLSIISKVLDEMQIEHLMLTGQSRNRTELVNSFQQGNVPVFLISLKAGGAGLNLTEADTVIHFDPWWNPAAENQASDRAHRIGQDKPVFIYKLIAKGTVEERIYQMQQHKSQLASEIYRQNDLIQQLEKPDWEKLLAPLGD